VESNQFFELGVTRERKCVHFGNLTQEENWQSIEALHMLKVFSRKILKGFNLLIKFY
jgi:hypothetical protein